MRAQRPAERMRQHAAFEEGVELVFDDSRRLGIGVGPDVGDEAGRVLLHQSVQRALLGAVAFAVERDAIWRLRGLPARGVHDGLPKG